MRRRAISGTLTLLFLELPIVAGCGGEDETQPLGPSPTPTATCTPTPTPTPGPAAFLIPLLPGADEYYGKANAVCADGRVVVGIALGDGIARAFYVRLP